MPLAVFFAFIGSVIYAYGIWRWRCVRALKNWLPIEAKIVKAELVQRVTYVHGMKCPYYIPSILFEYVVDGKSYDCSRFSIHNFTMGGKDDLKAILQGIGEDGRTVAYYDPKNPRQAILRVPGFGEVTLAFAIGGIILFLTGVLYFAGGG